MKTPRRRAREFAVQGLYQHLLNPDIEIAQIVAHLQENEYFQEADRALFDAVFTGTLNHLDAYNDAIVPHLDRAWAEVSPVERAVLLTACHELTAMPQTPYPVIINEAVEVEKTFGGTDGYKFVNGILDKLAAQLRPNDPPRRPVS